MLSLHAIQNSAKRYSQSFVITCIAVLSVSAQEIRINNSPDCPIQIIEASHLPNGAFRVSLRNNAETRLLAYVIRGTHNLTDSKNAVANTLEDYNGLGFAQPSPAAPAQRTAFSPRMNITFRPTQGQLVDSEFQIVYAETEDGKVFGPEAEKYKSLLDSERAARRNERLRLRSILQAQGIDGVLADLENVGNISVNSAETNFLKERREAVRVERNRLRHVLGQGHDVGLVAELKKD